MDFPVSQGGFILPGYLFAKPLDFSPQALEFYLLKASGRACQKTPNPPLSVLRQLILKQGALSKCLYKSFSLRLISQA
jgi:hypothetical protein